MDAIPCFCVGAVVLFVFGVWVGNRSKKRRQRWQQVAAQLNFEYSETGDHLIQTYLASLPLFTRGYLKRVRNLIEGQIGRHPIYLFDYSYSYRAGRHSNTRRQTVVAAWLEGCALPTFRLRPEGWFDRLTEALGFDDVDFPQYPRFSRQNHLKAADARAVQELFTPRLIRFFEVDRDMVVEAEGEWIAIYRPGRQIKVEQAREMLQESSQIVSALLSARD